MAISEMKGQGWMKTKTVIELFHYELECGPMPNLMVALLNIGGTLCSTPQFG